MPQTIDTNIEHYSVSELLMILDLDRPDETNITDKCDYYIEQFTRENKPDMVTFFREIKETLLDYVDELDNNDDDPITAELDSAREQSSAWYNNQVLKQRDKIQRNKVTDRKQKIKVFNNNHVPMNREQLGVSNTHNVSIAQDVLNPNLKNVTSRIIVLDSQYRQSSGQTESSTDYTLDLSEPLLNVLSLRLYSFAIPYTWYAIDTQYGNTCLWISIPNPGNATNPVNIIITIEPGNYTPTTIVTALTNSIQASGIDITGIQPISLIPVTPTVPVYINPNNGKLVFNLYGATYNYNSTILTIDSSSVLVFFDSTANLTCSGQPQDSSNNVFAQCVNPGTMAVNQTLGWVLGFRVPVQNILVNGNQAFSIPDLYGPKYFILVIDDLNQNHINSGLIGITETSKTLKLPNYYSPDLPYFCTPANPKGTFAGVNDAAFQNDDNAGVLFVDKLNASYSATPQFLPSAPRTLTQSQIYSINEIMKNNERTYNFKLKAPVVSDTFAILPNKLGSMRIGDVNVEFGGSMQDNMRIYFGPVNISRLRIKLLDDKGNVLNLNGADWCVTIISDNLYQY